MAEVKADAMQHIANIWRTRAAALTEDMVRLGGQATTYLECADTLEMAMAARMTTDDEDLNPLLRDIHSE